MTKPIPEGMHSITPYLMLKDAAKAIEFYKKAFGAKEASRLDMPDGSVGHAEITIGDSHIMISSGCSEMDDAAAPLGNSMLHLYCEDVDAMTKQAIAAGAEQKAPVQDRFYGDRAGHVRDPFGINWWVSTHKEDLSADEIKKRGQAEFAKMDQQKKSA